MEPIPTLAHPVSSMSGITPSGAVRVAFFISFLLLFVVALMLTQTGEVDGVGWHEEDMITDREYRDIELTDLSGDGTIEIGGILKSPEGGDPSAEFYSWDGNDWSAFPAEIAYKGIYNGIAIEGHYVAGAHSGGNSADAWWYNDVSGEFEFSEPDDGSVTENWSLSIAIGDLNNDSYPDIVAGYKTHGLKIFYGRADGEWDAGTTPKTSNMVKAVLIADVNNDSHPDIVCTHKPWEGAPSDPKKIEVYQGDGTGGWSTAKTVVSNSNLDYSTITAGDLNGDGYLDILGGSDSKTGIDRFLYQPVGSYYENSQIFSKGIYQDLQLHDIDGNGDLDIVGCRIDDGGINLYLGRGDGSFEGDDLGPVANGNVWSCVFHDLNDDGHMDIIAATKTGLFPWVQALPEVRNPVIPGEMYAMYDHYDLSFEVISDAILDDPDVLETVKLRFSEGENQSFILKYDSDLHQFTVTDGSQYVILDSQNSSRSNEGDGSIRITFRIMFKWAIADTDSAKGGLFEAYMKEERGSTGWVVLDDNPWSVISSIIVSDLAANDTTVNPGATVEVSGIVTYNGSDIPVPDNYLRWVEIKADGIHESSDTNLTDGIFLVNITLPEDSGTFVIWPEVVMFRGNTVNIQIPLPDVNVTIVSDYIVVTDMWITGESFYDISSQTYWQKAGESITFHTHSKWHVSGIAYEGELVLTNGTVSYPTFGRNFITTLTPNGVKRLVFVPANNSAFDNEFGPMLTTDLTSFPEVVWDGERPALLDFTPTSLVNGSEIKAVDAEVGILVFDAGLMEPSPGKGFGTFTIFWSIVQDENTTSNGSAEMVRTWADGNYSFTYDLPLSEASRDNIVLFWFSGNDTVGNEFISHLWPVRGTPNDPATVIVDPLPPAAPTGLYTSVGDGYIELRWLPNTEDDLAGYRVYRSTDGQNFSKSPISGLDLVPYNYFEDRNLENGKTYHYRITAVDKAVIPNESNFSEIVSDAPEEDEADDIMSLVMDNLLMVFITVVVLVIIIMGSIIAVRSRSKVPKDPSPPSISSLPPPQQKSSTAQQSQYPQPSPQSPQSAHLSQVGSFKTSSLPPPDQVTIPPVGGVLPAISWVCPSCTSSIQLGQGERFCTNCGYKIR